MTIANSYFSNSYTFEVANVPAQFSGYVGTITDNATAVIEYFSNYISWRGTLDFVVRFGSPTDLGHDGSGLLPSYGNVTASGDTDAAAEALTGIDPNGADWEAGLHLLPNADGTLTNYGVPLYFDSSPDAYEQPDIPAGTADFFSIFLHETLHSLGFWSTAQHGPAFGETTFDTLTREGAGGQFFFTGENTRALLGEDLPLAATGSRDHYGAKAVDDGAGDPVTRGAVFEFGNYEQNRWHLGQVDLAVLADLGYTVANQYMLALVEEPDALYDDRPPEDGGVTGGTPGDDVIVGTAGADTIVASAGDDTIDGRAGDDVVIYDGQRADFGVDEIGETTIHVSKPGGGADTLTAIERITFDDGSLIYDLDSTNGDAAYRLYGGAFDRAPDEAGLRYWTTDYLDSGGTLEGAAEDFIVSPEFIGLYGAGLTDSEYVDQLYLNVLGRPGEDAGVTFWNEALAAGEVDHADVLVDFTQLPEYVGNSRADIEDGYWIVG